MKRQAKRTGKAAFFTVGYQSHTPRTFLAMLARSGVEVLVDVRQNPVSRKAGFSRRALEESVATRGIDYLHFPSLGTPPTIRRFYAKTGDIRTTLDKYDAHLRSNEDCLRSLLAAVQRKQFCLLCLESDYTSCYRSVIARRLAEMMRCQPIHLA